MVGFQWLLLALVLLALAVVLLSVLGAARWSRATEALHTRPGAARSMPAVTRYIWHHEWRRLRNRSGIIQLRRIE